MAVSGDIGWDSTIECADVRVTYVTRAAISSQLSANPNAPNVGLEIKELRLIGNACASRACGISN
jgi:hypothetical protein